MNKYAVSVVWDDTDNGFIATVPEFPGLSAFGATQEEAVKEAQVALELFIEDMLEDGEAIPEPKKRCTYSGVLSLRIPKSLHQKISEEAEKEGVSQNTLINNLLSGSLMQMDMAERVCRYLDSKIEEMNISQRHQTNIVLVAGTEEQKQMPRLASYTAAFQEPCEVTRW